MKCRYRFMALLSALLILIGSACAENSISTRVIMKVSRITQNAVINVGEDLSMEVEITGVTPSSYQWYFNGAPIPGADRKIYTIVDGSVEDSGIYRMDAFDENGKMLVSMDISARVIDNTVPKSGDSSMPVGIALAGMAAAITCLGWTLLRKRKA